MKIQNVQTKDLIPYPLNNKKHSNAQIGSIIESIKEFGFIQPIVADRDFIVVIGHARLEAAKKIGLEEVPVLILTEATDHQTKRLRLLDNRLSDLGEYDIENIKSELDALGDDDLFELFEDLNIDFDEHGESWEWECDEDAIPQTPTEIFVKKGDIYQLGNHRIICGDSTDQATIKTLMNGEKSEMVFTDPPYLMNFEGSVHKDGAKSRNGDHGTITNDKMSEEDGKKFLESIISVIKSTNKGAFYICFYRLGIDKILNACNVKQLKWRNLVIWHKNNHNLSNSDYMSLYEPIVYGWVENHQFFGDAWETDILKITKKTAEPEIIISNKNAIVRSLDKYYKIQRVEKTKWAIDISNGAKLVSFDDSMGDVWEIEKTLENDIHPTMKPVALVERAINNSTKNNETVLDLFIGSGTTLIACEKTGRVFYGCELEPKYIQICIQRYFNFTRRYDIKCMNREVDINAIIQAMPEDFTSQ